MFDSPAARVESVGDKAEERAAGQFPACRGGGSRRNPRRRVLSRTDPHFNGGFRLCGRVHTRPALCSKGVIDPMANPFIHVELSTQDPAKSKEFYTKLFDWKLEEVPQCQYTLIGVGEG